ncbi:MAG: hypothetical protein EPGJADBJ_01098 [Saprospiraceae bacterium]|nr:hypothetical protein [Saprospiraceae bacterium]
MTHLEIIQHYYDCFNRQDWQGMLDDLHPDVRHDINQGETQVGIEAYRSFLQHMDECYRETLEDMVFMADPTGNRFACEFTVKGVYKKTDGNLPPAHGQTYTLPAGAFLEMRDGKIYRVTTYYNLPDWIKMVSA